MKHEPQILKPKARPLKPTEVAVCPYNMLHVSHASHIKRSRFPPASLLGQGSRADNIEQMTKELAQRPAPAANASADGQLKFFCETDWGVNDANLYRGVCVLITGWHVHASRVACV